MSHGARVLVTGGAGFIGSSLCRALLADGCHVTALDDFSTGRIENIENFASLFGESFIYQRGSVLNSALVEQLVEQSDFVFHLAAAVGVYRVLENPARTHEINVEGTRNVVNAVARSEGALFLASTSEVYGNHCEVPFQEDGECRVDVTSPRKTYAYSKRLGETMVLEAHRRGQCRAVVARLFNTIGPSQVGHHGMVVPRLVRQALEGKRLQVYGDGRQTRSFIGVDDAVAAIRKLATCESAAGEIVNIGSTEELSILDLARLILSLVDDSRDPETEIELVPYEKAYGASYEDTRRRLPSIEKMERLTGWRPDRPVNELIAEIVEACR